MSTVNAAITDDWSQLSTSTSQGRPAPQRQPVPDAWDDDDDDDEESVNAEDSQKVWETANSRAPMPSVIISSSSTANPSTLIAPPPETLRILKRPATSSSPSPSSTPVPPGGSLAEREARYMAARERIFAVDGSADAGGTRTSKEKEKQLEREKVSKRRGKREDGAAKAQGEIEGTGDAGAPTKGNVIRNPRGPALTGEATSDRGFASRGRGGRMGDVDSRTALRDPHSDYSSAGLGLKES